MLETKTHQDAVIIGGGFYGTCIAIYLAKQRGFKHIILIEREQDLLLRASYHNQARVHNGYHYPRSFTTAYRSRINLPKFLQDWPNAIKKDFSKLYAIARQNSKVTSKQFERFCREIGAKFEPADFSIRSLFTSRLIESVFHAEEYAFDSTKLAHWATNELKENNIRVHFETCATAIMNASNHVADIKKLNVIVKNKFNEETEIGCRYVFNCSYSGLNQIKGDFSGLKTGLKQEITEMALVELPPELKPFGITIMDGPFFSIMPFPARNLHTLSHVRYTPHLHWIDNPNTNPYERLDQHRNNSHANRMIRDAGRYLPSLLKAKHIDSLFEIKTLLMKNESDDGRPILFEKYAAMPGCYSILGGKIDNIYDVLEKLDGESFCQNFME